MKEKLLLIICEVYNAKYIGYLLVTCIDPFGYDVALGLNNMEKPIHITGQLTDEEFLKYFREEIRLRHLNDVDFFEGYKQYADDLSPLVSIKRNQIDKTT